MEHQASALNARDAVVIDAFTDVPFGGNAAGVVRIDGTYPPDADMLSLATELGFSETAFIRKISDDVIQLRYFTPTDEVELCGHATVASFCGLLAWGMIESGRSYTALTQAGELNIDVGGDGTVWMDMAPPVETGELTRADTEALYDMFGLTVSDAGALLPAIVNTGLPDIMMPVLDRARLAALTPDFDAIAELSRGLNVTGVHVFAPGGDGVTAYVRNFAPLFGIDEEAATGTSNGALTYYLFNRGMIRANAVNLFIQGEAMQRPSQIRSLLTLSARGTAVRIGGRAVIRPQKSFYFEV